MRITRHSALPRPAVGALEDICLVGDNKLMGDFTHGRQMVLGVLDVLEGLGVIRLGVPADEALEGLLMVVPGLPVSVRLKLSGLGSLGGGLA